MIVADSARELYVFARVLDYLGITLFVGGCLFVALLWPSGGDDPRTRRLLGIGWFLGLAGTLAAIAFQAAWVTQQPVTLAAVQQLLTVQVGRVWFAKALLWVLATVVLADLLQRREKAARSAAWRVGAGAVALGLLRTAGLTGHAVDAPDKTVAEIAALVHLAGVCAWFGGLAFLLLGVLPRRHPDELATVTPKYSRLAMISVIVIVLAGTVLALQLLPSLDVLVTTGYGRLLLIKLAVFAVILGAAQLSKRWVKRRLDFAVVLRGDSATVRPFVYSVAVETVLVVAVLVAASLLVTANPGR
ncbi:copper resistance D family protein [Kibdelosporangium aridum]|uniref:Copper transport protein n=1 Tax=Kibdelosporangium aridum TaxID=2030 RepID=A0A1W2AN00_KIBAR|nr:CopD family protein [Kibdelosporangium aridum]SMC62077.1 copper transport protein [Kibdelosporangium aridum]